VTPAMVRKAASLFREASVIIQPGVGHFPWVEDPAAFAAAANAFLA
jgi:pimeloyl-ACP methyl ester carboxylesterase